MSGARVEANDGARANGGPYGGIREPEPDNQVGGYYGLRKGYRGRFANT